MKSREGRADGLLYDHQEDSDDGEIEDDDNLPLFYHRRPEFEWTGGHTITETVYDRFVTLLIGYCMKIECVNSGGIPFVSTNKVSNPMHGYKNN